MNRWLSAVVAGVVVASVGATFVACNTPTCGPGTVQKQDTNGKLRCEPVDYPAPLTPCDTDGGATIVGGFCVSAITCGSGTKLVGNQCLGTGGTPTCGTPNPGTACVSGALVNLVDTSASTDTVHVALYDPLSFLQGGPALAEQDTSGGYIFNNFTPPSDKLIAVVVSNSMGSTMFAKTATGDQGVVAGSSYQVDAYVLPKTVTDGWKPAIDVDTTGAYLARFFNDPKPPPTLLKANEKTPVAGVQLYKNGAPDSTVKYFDTNLLTIGTGTSTGAIGSAIMPTPPEVATGAIPNFSGNGPSAMPITWEVLPGGSAVGYVFVTRFHPNM